MSHARLWRPWSFVRLKDGRVAVMRYTALVGHVQPQRDNFVAVVGETPRAFGPNIFRPLRFIVAECRKEMSDAKALKAAPVGAEKGKR